jgi:hypothetical protein
MNCQTLLRCFTTRQLLPGSKPAFVPPCLAILWMQQTTLKSSSYCLSADAATFCLDIVYPKTSCALSSSSAKHCAVRTPERRSPGLGKYFGKGKHAYHADGLVSGSRSCVLAHAKRRPALTARQFLNLPNATISVSIS